MTGKVKSPLAFSCTYSARLFSTYVDDETREIYDALMASQLVLSWTAFETLAGDLWEAAINAHPRTLATRASEGLQHKSISIKYLSAHNFNLYGSMGTVLRNQRGNPFQTLDGMADAYQTAFPKGPRASSPEFWDDKNVLAACLLRNLFVHRAGIVDDDFASRRGDDDRLARFNRGDQFYLDGKLLTDLLGGVFEFSDKLIRSVDDWICVNR